MDERYCKTCERFVDLDELQIVTESNRITVAYDKTRGICHDLLSSRATKRKLANSTKIKSEIVSVQAPIKPASPVLIAPPIPETAAVIKKHQLLGTARSELNNGGFTIVDGDDGQEYLLRGDGIIPDINGRRALRAGEHVIFTPSQYFKKNIAKEVIPLNRVNDPVFKPNYKDWYDLKIKFHDTDKGFAVGNLVGIDIEVFVSSRTVVRQSTYKQAFRDIKPGDVLAVRIKPSDEFPNKFESIVAMIEDMPEVPEENSQATLGDIYAQPGDEILGERNDTN